MDEFCFGIMDDMFCSSFVFNAAKILYCSDKFRQPARKKAFFISMKTTHGNGYSCAVRSRLLVGDSAEDTIC